MDEQYQELLRCIESLNARETIQELGGDVLDRIKKRFVLDNPRVWWLSFRFPSKEHHYDDDQYKRISCFLNNEDFCYFIAELDVTHIFKARVADVVFIIGECSFFEYYVVSMDLKKLICETEHGDFLEITISGGLQAGYESRIDTFSFRLSSQCFSDFLRFSLWLRVNCVNLRSEIA